MDILMITHFTTFPWEKGNGRFVYLADLLTKDGNDVEMVTSSFFHTDKVQRDYSAETLQSVPYKITVLKETGYKKNVSLKRLKSHKKFAKNVKRYLATRAKPDVVYCSIPSLDVAKAAAEYCSKNGVKFIIDVQDLWPEAFKMVFHVPVLSSIMFAPMDKKANKAYSAADEVIAVSKTYANRAMRVNKKCKSPHVVYLGTDKEYFDECAAAGAPDCSANDGLKKAVDGVTGGDKKVRLVYVGTLGSSYDLPTVFAAMKKLDEKTLSSLEMIVMGDGPKRKEFEAAAAGLPVVFTGNLIYRDMVWVLSRCDIAVNPIKRGAAQSIINKHMDYAMAGLAVINTQESEEYRSLIDKYSCGINCECENASDVAAAIQTLVNDGEKAKELGKNSRLAGERLFDRKQAYKEITNIIYGNAEKTK